VDRPDILYIGRVTPHGEDGGEITYISQLFREVVNECHLRPGVRVALLRGRMTFSVTSSSQPFRIAVYPPRVVQRGNPYFALCHAALEKHGIVAVDDLEVDVEELRGRAGALHALHLHWPEDIWRQDFGPATGRLGRASRAVRRLFYLRRFLRAARAMGIARVWTVHNMEPHEGAYRWDHYGYRLLARETDLVICHSRSTMEAVQREYRPRGRVILMPIGELGSAYPAARPRAEVLGELGLDPERPTVACLGRLRDYKGLDLACEAVGRLDGRVQLIMGGPSHAGFDAAPLRAAVERTPGLVLIDRAVTDQEFADIMGASDAALLSYRKITGSAALLSALGFGRGVIASDLAYFREILDGEPDAGLLVPSRDPDDWARAIEAYLARPAEVRRRAASRLADRYSWDRSVEPLVAALRRNARTVDVDARVSTALAGRVSR
jgi:beta-1,4-mannosyltransferase